MSKRYPGGLITKTPVTPTPSAAPGIWTLEQQLQAQQAGTWPFGGPFNYIEDVFSTYLYTGTEAAQTITNNINLSGQGGLVWIKSRSASTNNNLFDTAQGTTKSLHSNTTDSTVTDANSLTAFGTTGFTLGSGNTFGNEVNTSSATYASWTFRKQPKFFDVVTYTGTGANRTVSHNLGSVPGCIIVKKTSSTGNWRVYHNSLTSAAYTIQLNQTNSQSSQPSIWNSTAPTSTVFSVGTDIDVNESGQTYVAYLFAHNAGGFGLTGSDNVISCGSFTTNGSGIASVTLGYEPQWLLVKSASGTSNWWLADNMRGMTASNQTNYLSANTSLSENGPSALYGPTATGFNAQAQNASETYIYIAIRRGPMKVPTDATKVFYPGALTGTAVAYSTGFPVDLALSAKRSGDATNVIDSDRLRGGALNNLIYLSTSLNSSEATNGAKGLVFDYNTFILAVNMWGSTEPQSMWAFRRAPGFFDEVCYTGTGASQTVNHNLTVAPEMIIGKQRNGTFEGQVWHKDLGYYSGSSTYGLYLFSSTGANAKVSSNAFGGTPTSTQFVASTTETANSGSTFVAYLFATCPGVSKVGSYSGTGATQTINCGFTGGARFVLIKRTDSTGDWYVWDTARGMVAGTDPSLLLNTTAAEVNANSVYTTGVGFQIVSTAAGINASGGTYIFLAVA